VLTSVQRPLQDLADVMQRFVRGEARLLCVETQPRMRAASIQVLRAAEHLADNRRPLLTVELTSARDADSTWEAATDELRRVHTELREHGSPLAAITGRPLRTQGSANFAAQALQCLGTVRAPASGLLLLIIPPPSGVEAAWLVRLGEAIRNHRLADARFIVVLTTSPSIAEWIASFEAGTCVHQTCAIDERRATDELAGSIEVEERMGPGFTGAWPRGVRPPGRRESAAPDPAKSLRVQVKRAALAMREDDGPEAIRRQAAARDLCLEHGRIRDAIAMELVLGAYMLQLGQHPLAITAFDKAARSAHESEHWDLEAQGHLAAASTHDAAGDPTAALASYRHAIEAARRADDPRLLFTAYWEAGQVALRLGLEIDCIALWGDAFADAQARDATRLRGTRAKDVTLELAKLLARYRRYSDAREVERAAGAFGASA
jgi:tetratricopeptide (TPR) repeat protein